MPGETRSRPAFTPSVHAGPSRGSFTLHAASFTPSVHSILQRSRPLFTHLSTRSRAPFTHSVHAFTRGAHPFTRTATPVRQFANWIPVCKPGLCGVQSTNWTFKTSSLQTESRSLQTEAVRKLGPTYTRNGHGWEEKIGEHSERVRAFPRVVKWLCFQRHLCTRITLSIYTIDDTSRPESP